MTTITQKRTRHERKMARNAMFDQQKQKHQQEQERLNSWRMAHPVSSGLIPIVDYIPPR